MDENVKVPSGARPRIVHQTRATGFETRDCAREVGYFDGYVMQPFAALVDEFGDHRIRFRGFQQLDARVARRQHGDVHSFLLDGFAQANREAELLFVEGERGVERSHGDAEMINL